MRVADTDAGATHELRRRVLRSHLPGADVDHPEDHLAGTIHLGVIDGGAVIATATMFPEATPYRPAARAVRLRGMAVAPEWQGRGVGALLLEAVVDRARAEGYEVVWANGRDSALGFYRRRGWEVVGEGFTSIGLPHHVVLLDL